jgi:AraC family transcriptional regulator, regulatory protein of adaptative response / methylated-DNA-[protein]-cysteine methyltransferase
MTDLKSSRFETPLGPMLAIANDEALLLLEFVDCRGLEREIERLKQKTNSTISPGITKPIRSIENELDLYFKGELKTLKSPLHLMGSPFQNQVWIELAKIPPGETRSYAEIARAIGRPTAFRAVAQAIGANQLAVIIPCHRVINSNGALGGYAGGLSRKEWLINHEKNNINFLDNEALRDHILRFGFPFIKIQNPHWNNDV